jgi:hypothetical protein
MSEWKYEQLKEALGHYWAERRRYEEEAVQVSGSVREALANVLGCPITTVRFAAYKDEDVGTREIPEDAFLRFSSSRGMWLDKEAYWHFRWNVTFDGARFLTLYYRAKKQADSFVVCFGEKKYEIVEGKLAELIEQSIDETIEWLQTDHERFVRGEQSMPTLGFLVPRSDDQV